MILVLSCSKWSKVALPMNLYFKRNVSECIEHLWSHGTYVSSTSTKSLPCFQVRFQYNDAT